MKSIQSAIALIALLALSSSTSTQAQASRDAAWNSYREFTNQLVSARFRITTQPSEFGFSWHTNETVRLGFTYAEARGFLEPATRRVIEVSDAAAREAGRFNRNGANGGNPPGPTQTVGSMAARAKEVATVFGWEITDALAPAWPLAETNRFSPHLGNWGFRWHRTVNGFRIFHERIQVFISDRGGALESFKSTLTTKAYAFPVGPQLTTNALHAAIIQHEKLNFPEWLARGTPDRKLPEQLIVKEMVPPAAPARELFVVEADYTRRWNYPTPTKGPGGKAKEFRLAYHIYYFILDGTPGRGQKELRREFGCFDAITGAALMHDW